MKRVVIRRAEESCGLWEWEPVAIFALPRDARDHAARITRASDDPALVFAWHDDDEPAYLAMPDAYVYGERIPYLGEVLLAGRSIGVQL